VKPILQVEDEEHDVLFMEMALQNANVENRVIVARDGHEAIAYLKGEGKFEDRQLFPLPRLVLLDLKLLRMPGLDVLQWIRQQTAFSRLPVIVCSSSNHDADVEAAYRLGANGYVVKPCRPAEMLEIVRRIKKYWLDASGPTPNCEDWLSVIEPQRVTTPRH